MIRTFGILLTAVFLVSGCNMYRSDHEEILKGLKGEHEEAMGKLTKEKEDLDGQKKQCEDMLKGKVGELDSANATLAAKTMQIDKLLTEKGALNKERQELSAEQQQLARQIQELQRMKAAAEKRNADYKRLLGKLKKMIDAGTLQVKIRNGRMIVQMSSDVVFPSASVRIKAEAKEAIMELAQTISTFTDRKFQIVGHSDPTPIHTARFPSNWELSSQRAIEVVKLMVEAGVPPEMISAAGNAEFDPLTENETPEGRTTNRRVEIVFVPKIEELPGFDQVMGK
ncbi:OmpA family protein [Myxococcota bacterium]